MTDTAADANPTPAASAAGMLHNFTFDELQTGQSAQRSHTLTEDDVRAFAAMSGDANPAHLDAEYAAATPFRGVIAHGMWGAGLVSAVLGTQLPGPGTIYLSQDLRFTRPVRIGDTVTATLTVTAKDAQKRHVVLDCVLRNQRGQAVITGTARVLAPDRKICRPRPALPTITLNG